MNIDLRFNPPANRESCRIRGNRKFSSVHGHEGDIRVISGARSESNGQVYTWQLNVVNVPSGPAFYDPSTVTTAPPNGPSEVMNGQSVCTITSIPYPITEEGSIGLYQYMIIQSEIVPNDQAVDNTHGLQFILSLPSNPNTNEPARLMDIDVQSQQCYMYSQYDYNSPMVETPPDYIVIQEATVYHVHPIPDVFPSVIDAFGINFLVTVKPINPVFVPFGARLVLLLVLHASYGLLV